jgi:arsenate reductase (thioredoxin)
MHIDQSPLMRHCLKATVAELAEEFRGVFSRETVARYVERSYEDVGDRPTVGPNFLPVIIARFAREQIAAAFAHQLSNGWVGVRSAGSHPEEQIDPVAVDAMRELGADVTLQFPKSLTDDVLRAADVVVTLGCGDACPVYPSTRYQDWPVADPAGQPLDVVRRIRYDLYHRVWDLLEALVPMNTLVAIHGPIGDGP